MSDIAHTDVVFDGINGITGDILVRTIRRRVLIERIHDDDRLIALTAGSYFQGPALDWYEDQTEETQESWKLLRRAILVRWPSSPVGAAPPLSSSSNIPTPAAASPNTVAAAPAPTSKTFHERNTSPDWTRRGRIRVEFMDGRFVGYVSTIFSRAGNCQVTSDESDIAHVRFTPNDQFHDIQFMTRESEVVKLGVTLYSSKTPQELIDEEVAWGTVVKITGDNRQSSTTQTGPWCSNVWSISTDGKVLASWEIKPRVHRELTLAYGLVIGVANDFERFQSYFIEDEIVRSTKVVKMFFEPI